MTHFSTGRIDGTLGPIRHATQAEAEAWLAEREKIDPKGVEGGAYYLDAPGDDNELEEA